MVAATVTGLVLVYYTNTLRGNRSNKGIQGPLIPISLHAEHAGNAETQANAQTHAIAQDAETQQFVAHATHESEVKSDVLESIVAQKREDSLEAVTAPLDPLDEKKLEAKKKKAKLKQTVIDGVNLVMGESAGKLVESIIEISATAKKSGGLEALLKSGKLGKIFSKDIIPFLKKKLQNKKFPTIVGTTDSPLGDLHYEVSGITLESLDIDPSLQCDITDKNEALQIKVLISSALLKNISWKCGTSKIKEKGTANAEIVKAICLFRISLDKAQPGVPRLSIKHCSIDLQQFNLDLKGGKASWVYNKLTSVFNNKIKAKLKEKIDKTLTKKCAMIENKINFAASKVFSLLGKKGKKSPELLKESSVVVPHKKCFLYSNESHNEELDCVLLDLQPFSDVAELRIAFFGEVGLPHLAQQTNHTRIRFRDRSGTLISISKSTTISQIIEHAEYVCFYRDSLSSSFSSSSSVGSHHRSLSSLSTSSSTSTASFTSLSSSYNGLNGSQRGDSFYDDSIYEPDVYFSSNNNN